ncbi:HGGxSTG domain-containing protein [Ralstonia sp. TCR112]|uniref:HGGxSTG domain-containing protein n=1 Tax=Ralstonia sp. TCR112 TaxID=2601730 RepID=UPI002D809434|nr:HGGxSTG domain-containing protein [Ralstonia sp. TCR112]
MASTCGAKTRSGAPCKRAPMEGKTRCKLHGGASTGAPKGNANAVKHGFYSDALTSDERVLYERAEVGSLDDEIRLARVKLHRFVRLSGSLDLMDMVDGALQVTRKIGEEYDRATESMQPYDKKELKAAAPDYADLIIRQIDLIRKLELARRDLMADEDGDAPESIRITVRRARKDE